MKALSDNINYVWYFEWPGFHSTKSRSPEEHTIQYLLYGSYNLEIDNRTLNICRGDIVYYSDFEEHTYTGREEPTAMYSINFSSPLLSEDKPTGRVFRGFTNLEKEFRTIHEGFNGSNTVSSNINTFRSLFIILTELFHDTSANQNGRTDRWNSIESYIKTEKEFRLKPAELSERFGMSSSTLYRVCREATGMSPEKRVRELRMDEAVKLLRHTNMNISEIAFFLKYVRLHDFSRDFSIHFGKSPTEFQKSLRTG